jgi:tetratricopeptide (TPR) repeat protein
MLLEAYGENEEILSNLAALHFTRNDGRAAKEASERLLKLNPQSETALRILGDLFSEEGDEESVAKYVAQLADVSPDSFDVWYNLALACQKTGRLEVTVDAYKKSLEVNPESAEALNNLGCAYHELEDVRSARESYEASLRIEEEHPGVCWNLALATESQGVFKEAERCYSVVVARQPGWKEAALRLRRLQPAQGAQ